ncbi:rCG53407 [Rattus norvegicus]|uniref:RCG53407 n=1 Tax=Rattus norvegicus TaxID=10116 RepID=A6JRS7_RAT|nr:rCG53407 [Rattus norvegicus]
MACSTLSAEWAPRFSDDTQEKAMQDLAPSTFLIYSSPLSGKAIVQKTWSCSLRTNTKRRLVL